jgi:ribonuclease BN (tRNA processing enzyme)
MLAMTTVLKTLHERQRSLPVSSTLTPEVTFLGTGAAAPSKYRSSSGVDITLPQSDTRILIDCGEGTLGQLHRALGPALDPYMRALRLVWISHRHADHHVRLRCLPTLSLLFFSLLFASDSPSELMTFIALISACFHLL